MTAKRGRSDQTGKRPEKKRPFVLPDVLAPALGLVFCGTAAGRASASARAYYAHPGNRFWKTLHAVGLTPRRFAPHEFQLLLELGIGLTDLAKFDVGNDDELPSGAFDRGELRVKVELHRPGILAFTSKNAARAFLDGPVDYGLQAQAIGPTKLFVLPSPSGQAVRFFDLEVWEALAQLFLQHGSPR